MFVKNVDADAEAEKVMDNKTIQMALVVHVDS